MSVRSEDHYLLVVGRTDHKSPGCVEAITHTGSFRYDEASSVADAIELAERRRPSLIVVNLRDVDQSGLDVCRELVAAESTRDVPILAVAGTPPERQFMISLAVKPCDVDSLDEEIQRLIGN